MPLLLLDFLKFDHCVVQFRYVCDVKTLQKFYHRTRAFCVHLAVLVEQFSQISNRIRQNSKWKASQLKRSVHDGKLELFGKGHNYANHRT